MQRYRQDDIEWLEFDLLKEIASLKHAVFLKHGGNSKGNFNSLNASDYVGDNPPHVQANLRAIESHLQQHTEQKIQLFWTRNCHGTKIAAIQPNSPQESTDYDALVTQMPGCALLISHADCQSAFFYDPIHRVIANVHAGWRGSIANIYHMVVQYMEQAFDSRSSNILVCIGPSLGPESAEFIHYEQEIPAKYWDFQVKPNYFDFWALSEHQLRQAGILPHHIEIARIDTYSNPQDYFSYRRSRITGRHASCIMNLYY